jgi:alcohol dehydrogenase class IV
VNSSASRYGAGGALRGEFEVPQIDSVVYGPDEVGVLPGLVERYGSKRVFAIVSSTLARAGVLDDLRGLLKDRLVGAFGKTPQHVPRRAVLEAAELARSEAADMVISVGGGTPIDCAKAVVLCLGEGMTREEQFDEYYVRFTYPDKIEVPPVRSELIPHIALPTTLSAAEHNSLIGITDQNRQEKHLYSNPHFLPRVVILDPLLTKHTPGWLWAASGMRAVDHAVEGILSLKHGPFMDALGLEALRILRRNLTHSASNPDDISARMDCMLAAWLSIFALSNAGVGLSHGIGHQLAAQFDVTHGITSCITLPLVMEFNAAVVAPRLRRVAEALGVDVRDMSDEGAAEAAVEEMRSFVRSLDVPYTLSAVGGRREELGVVADHTLQDMAAAVNPRRVTREELIALLEAAWDGSRLSRTG